VPDWLETTQFLTDVTIAAGLLAYGRRDKGLAQRLGDFVYKYRMLEARRNGSEIAMSHPLETLKWPPTSEPCRRCAAFEGLTKAQEAQLSHHREQADKYREAIATLGSEREANELLTTRIAALESNLKLARELLVISETDAERYREIRNWCWYESEAAVVHSPKASVKLGSVCLSHEFLDEFVDQKLARRQEGEQGQKT
jgi:pyruvate-formate lyase